MSTTLNLLVEWEPTGNAQRYHLADGRDEVVCGHDGDISGPHECRVPPDYSIEYCADCGVDTLVEFVEDADGGSR